MFVQTPNTTVSQVAFMQPLSTVSDSDNAQGDTAFDIRAPGSKMSHTDKWFGAELHWQLSPKQALANLLGAQGPSGSPRLPTNTAAALVF